jgi:hypothetical protein
LPRRKYLTTATRVSRRDIKVLRNKHTLVVPAAHTKADVEDWPFPEFGGEVILLVGVRNKSVVGGHHGDVEMDEVL